jgi:citrate synthase
VLAFPVMKTQRRRAGNTPATLGEPLFCDGQAGSTFHMDAFVKIDATLPVWDRAGMNDGYITAEEAAEILGVRRSTIYAYVSRKGVRSQQVEGTRQHRYWRPDVEALRSRSPRGDPRQPRADTNITLVTEDRIFYRGQDAAELAETATFEEVAALLWQAGGAIFSRGAPRASALFAELDQLLHAEAGVDRALAHFPFLEHANPRCYDLSRAGMAATGVDITRWLTAIVLNTGRASDLPIHLQFEQSLGLSPEVTDLLRRLLVLAADHGINEETRAVRAMASTGVTPWRAVAAGLAIAVGRHSRFGQNDSLRRFVTEILATDNPEAVVVRSFKEGENVPGFDSLQHPGGDPRATALLDYGDRALHDHWGFKRLRRAIDLAREFRDLRPNFALISTFAEEVIGLQSRRDFIGLSSSEAPYLVGRSAGWVAHCIEETAGRSPAPPRSHYRGVLPPAHV